MNEGNGEIRYLHPEAVSALAQDTAVKQASDRQLLEGMAGNVTELRKWAVTVTDQLNAIQAARFAWPSAMALAALLLGGFGGALVWLIAAHH